MSKTLPIWCSNNPSGLLKPSDDMIKNGFKKSTVGKNYWLNYVLNQLTIHTQIPVGAIKPHFLLTLEGFLPLNGSTFGSAASTATATSDDYEDVFLLLWPNITITPSKGASAADDWAANKVATLPNAQGCQMRAATAGQPLLTVMNPTAEKVALTVAEMPIMKPTINDPEHHHGLVAGTDQGTGGESPRMEITTEDGKPTFNKSATGITIDPIGGNPADQPNSTPHNNVQPSLLINWFIKY